MSHGYGEARPIGHMVPHATRQTPPAPATCARCACKLSRYRDHSDGQLCAPCKRAVKAEAAVRTPAFAPRRIEHAPSGGARRCDCGAFLHRDTKGNKCRVCYEEPRHRTARRCDECAKPISAGNKGGLCWDCVRWNRAYAASKRQPPPCPDCGGTKKTSAERCRVCDNLSRLHPERRCPECGGRKALKRALLCRSCRDKAGGARNAHKAAARSIGRPPPSPPIGTIHR